MKNTITLLLFLVLVAGCSAPSTTSTKKPSTAGASAPRISARDAVPLTFTPTKTGLKKTSFKVGGKSMTIEMIPVKTAAPLPPALPGIRRLNAINIRPASVVPTNEWFKLQIFRTPGTNQFTVNFWKDATSRVNLFSSTTPQFDTNTEVIVAIVTSWPQGPGWPTEMLIKLGGAPFVYATVGPAAFLRLHVNDPNGY